MATNPLPLPSAGFQRIPFAQASPQLVAQALTDAKQRLVRHSSTVRWTTWRDTLYQLQLDVLVEGNAVTFDWQDLVRWVQCLATSLERRGLDPPTEGDSDAQFRACQQQAVHALAELQENPHGCGPLVYALVMQLAQGYAEAARGIDAAPGACPPPANPPRSLGLEPPLPSQNPAEELVKLRGRSGLAPSGPLLPQPNSLGRVPRRPASRRRTFRAIVERHPRVDGKVGFTVRELCITMRISAASLAHARVNPGHLSVEKVVALAEAMEECPLQVLSDLLQEAGAKKRRERKKRAV